MERIQAAGQGRSAGAGGAVYDEGLREHMSATYRLLSGGLALTAAAAWVTVNSPLMGAMAGPEGLTGVGMAIVFAPLAIIVAMAFGFGSSPAATRTLFWAFALLKGPGLALFVSQYADASVVKAAAAAAAAFGGASLYGYTTRRSLASMGAFMFMGLIGLLVALLVNLFLASPALDFAVSAMAVVVFTGLAAWDTQRIKDAYDDPPQGGLAHARYVAALSLYLSVVNLFVFLLNLMGNRE